MAQRTEKEETDFKVPETITLCVNNCGVIGNPATNNMCQKCFNATTTTTATTSSASASTTNLKAPISTTTSRSSYRSANNNSPSAENTRKTTANSSRSTDDEEPAPAKRVVNRCSGCQRKVGLTGFRCRCGELFCAEHRYTDRHDCSYDYKTAGREAIARENPVVKAAKIVRV